MTSHDTVTFDAPPDAGTLSRRRELSATARSLLLTVLGEFVLPRGEPVWTRALLDLLGELGVEQKSARQALSRTAAEGLIDSSREGRRVRWELTESGHRLLSAGAHRIYTFGTSEVAWDGRWLVLLASVPESRRQLRHRLRTRLAWAGFGSPAPAVWLSPDAEKQAEAAEVIRELGLTEVASSFVGPFGPIGEQREMVAQAWNLDRVELAYQDFIATFQRTEPSTPADVAREQINLVHAWRRFPFLDPQLPAELLPTGWIGDKATELFHDRHRLWDADARRHWEHLLRTAD